MNPFLKYGALILAAISFVDFFITLAGEDHGNWTIIGFSVNYFAYLGFKFVTGIAFLAYGLGFGRVEIDGKE